MLIMSGGLQVAMSCSYRAQRELVLYISSPKRSTIHTAPNKQGIDMCLSWLVNIMCEYAAGVSIKKARTKSCEEAM